MTDRSRFDNARTAVHSIDGDSNVGDENVGLYLAERFCAAYGPNPPTDHSFEAAKAIEDTLSKGIPGCLTKDQMLDEDVQALLFAATAAKHGWVKR